MDFEELNTFLEVIRTQSLVAAARHRYVTDSKGYLPARVVDPLLASGRLHRVE